MPLHPLSKRKYDWFFIAFFSLFALLTLLTDMAGILIGRLQPGSDYFFERILYSYAQRADPLLIVNPPQVRASAWISAIIFFPMHVYFVAAFAKGWNKVRLPALIYGGALIHSMVTYMAEGMYGTVATTGWQDQALCPGCTQPDRIEYLLVNIVYFLVPLLLIFRVWKPEPFGTETE